MSLELIADSDELYRRLAPGMVKPDGSVSSAAYKVNKKPDNEISVDLARLTTIKATLGSKADLGFGVGSIIASHPRELGFEVLHDPLLENEAHSLVHGENTKETRYLLAEKTYVIVPSRSI